MAEVDAEQWRAALARQLGRPQDRAVTADDDDDLAVRGGVGVGRDHLDLGSASASSVGLLGQQPRGQPVLGEAPAELTRHLACVGAPDVGDHQDAALVGGGAAGHGPSLSSGAPRIRRTTYLVERSRPPPPPPGRGAATRSTPRCRPGRAAGWWSPPRAPQPRSAASRATSETASARSSGSRTTPPRPTRPLPTSNCGFTISTRSPSSARSRRAARRAPAAAR